MSIPGIGPTIATAIEALAPPAETFRSGRDFSARSALAAPREWSNAPCGACRSSPAARWCAGRGQGGPRRQLVGAHAEPHVTHAGHRGATLADNTARIA